MPTVRQYTGENLMVQFLQMSAVLGDHLENIRARGTFNAEFTTLCDLLAVSLEQAQDRAEAVLTNTALSSSSPSTPSPSTENEFMVKSNEGRKVCQPSYITPKDKEFMKDLASQISTRINKPFSVSDLMRTLAVTANIDSVIVAIEKMKNRES